MSAEIEYVRRITLNLINRMNEPFYEYWEDCVIILFELSHLKHFTTDKVVKKQISYMLDYDRNLVSGLFRKWRLSKQFPRYFIDEIKPTIEEAFDIIEGRR